MELLHAQVVGEGKPFLILHGLLGSGDNWRTLARHYANEGYEMHLVDLRNHGRSFHTEAFNYELMVADLKHYVDTNNLKDIVLLGHSMGGKVAMSFAIAYPELISKLLIADIGPKKYPQHHQAILKGLSSLDFADPEIGKQGISSRGEAEEVLAEYEPSPGVRQFLLKNLYWESKGKLALRMNLDSIIKNIEEVGKPLPVDAVYKGETCFIYGGKSQYILPEDIPMLKRHFPNSELVEIKGVGHWLHAEKPEEFSRIVLGFL